MVASARHTCEIMDREPLFQQIVRAARLDQSFYTKLLFDDYATANGVLVVAMVYALWGATSLLAGVRALPGLIGFMLTGLIGWVIVAIVLWAMATKLFARDGRIPSSIRLTGFAHVPLALMAIRPLVSRYLDSMVSILDSLVFVIALVWFFAALVVAARALYDLGTREAAASALMAVAGWWVAFVVLF